jgi:hypothetical protein
MEAKMSIDRMTVNSILEDLYANIEDRYEVQFVKMDEDHPEYPTMIYLWDPNYCGGKAEIKITYFPFQMEIKTAMSSYVYMITEIEENEYQLYYNGAYNGLGRQQLLPPTIENIIKLKNKEIIVKSSTSTQWVDMTTYIINRAK